MLVELLSPLTHAGADYPPGATIDLDDDRARWLIDLGGARPASPAHDPPAADAVASAAATKSRRKGD